MKNKILDLLTSSNLDDRVLGIVLMEENNIPFSTFSNSSDNTAFYIGELRVKAFDRKPFTSLLVAVKGRLYNVCYNGFIGLFRESAYNKLLNEQITGISKPKLMWTDNSIDTSMFYYEK